jgi:2-polyprenyl-3-methyl-5-hydroxy-6-metoxy-1,4-benzoquinol methylase
MTYTRAGQPPDGARWNTNIHYHDTLLAAVPAGARQALDVGCGEGLLTRRLRERIAGVIGIDSDPTSIELARRQCVQDITYICGDFFDHEFAPASFDVVVSVATLHHMEAKRGLRRMRGLVRPGGVLGIIGLARSGPADLLTDLAAVAASTALRRRWGWYEPQSPLLWPPPATFGQMHRM